MHEPYPGEPVPAVNAADLKSVWPSVRTSNRRYTEESSLSIA